VSGIFQWRRQGKGSEAMTTTSEHPAVGSKHETIGTWINTALNLLANDERDEMVLFVRCRGGMFKFTIQIFRQDGPE
jgi:hypothetical protein